MLKRVKRWSRPERSCESRYIAFTRKSRPAGNRRPGARGFLAGDLLRLFGDVAGRTLPAAPEVLGEEALAGQVELLAVLRTHEAVAFVGEEQVLVGKAALLQGRDDLLGLRLLHARVVGALRDEHRDLDL